MTVSAHSPCRTAFRRDRLLPSSVFGPVLMTALRRLASICRNEVMGWRAPRHLVRRCFCIVGGIQLGTNLNLPGCDCGIAIVQLKQASCPQLLCLLECVYLQIGPPRPFVAMAMQLLVMLAAQRHGEFVADLESER